MDDGFYAPAYSPLLEGVPARRGVRLLLLENEWFPIP